MFIRNKLGTNNRISVQIVESIRNGKKISQKVLETIGSTDKTDRKRLQSLKSIAEGRLISIKKDRLDSPQFETKKPGRRKKKSINDIKPITNVLLSNITQITQIIDGVDDITEQAYSEFGFEKLFPKSTNSILKKLITFRITSTYRKEKLWQVLLDNFDHNYTINRVLRVLDYIYPKLDKLHQQMLTSFKNLVPQSTALYIKIRRLHFSAINSKPIIELDNHDNFKIKSLDYTIVIVSNEFGLPLDYLILNDSEIKLNNLLPHINEWVKLFIPTSVYFIGDKSLFHKSNLAFLEKHKYYYIITTKLRKLPAFILNEITDESRYKAISIKKNIVWVNEIDIDTNKKLITTYSIRQIKKDVYNRINDRNTLAFKNKYLHLSHNQQTSSSTTDILHEDKSSFNEELLDGMQGIVTNIYEINSKELLKMHQKLADLNDLFKLDSLKYHLEQQPNERIESHIALCFIAYAMSKYIQFKVELTQNQFSKEDVIGILLGVRSVICSNSATGDLYRIPCNISTDAQYIYKAFAINRGQEPSIYIP